MRKGRRKSTAFLAVMMAVFMIAGAFALTPSDDAAARSSGAVGKRAALKIALKNAGLERSEVKSVETEKDDDGSIEVGFVRIENKAEYDYEISAKDGRILEKTVDYKYKKIKSKKKIGSKKAMKKVAKASGKKYSTVKKGTCEYKYKKHQGKYEIEFRSGDYEYDYELLAPNGRIIEYGYEYVGTR